MIGQISMRSSTTACIGGAIPPDRRLRTFNPLKERRWANTYTATDNPSRATSFVLELQPAPTRLLAHPRMGRAGRAALPQIPRTPMAIRSTWLSAQRSGDPASAER